jgi:hypothetical protein
MRILNSADLLCPMIPVKYDVPNSHGFSCVTPWFSAPRLRSDDQLEYPHPAAGPPFRFVLFHF